jgi:hypothetical protein
MPPRRVVASARTPGGAGQSGTMKLVTQQFQEAGKVFRQR